MPSKGRSTSWLYLLQILSALLGVGISLYLFVQHTRLKNGIQGGPSFCTVNSTIDCDAVNASQFSELGGVPLGAVGAFFYFVLLLLSVLASPSDPQFRKTQRWQRWLAIAGLAIDVVLLVVQVAVLKKFCLMCFGTYIAGFGVFISNYLMRDVTREAEAPLGKKAIFGASGAVLFLAFLIFVPRLVLKSSGPANAGKIEAVEGDGTFGNPNAKVRIVEFSDFECPHCKRAAAFVHDALKPLEDKVFFIFKNFPLDSSCNSALQYPMHLQACNLARLSACAQAKGKFWEYHDVVFNEVPEADVKKGLDAIAPHLWRIFTKDEIMQCLQSPMSSNTVAASVQLGIGLNITATPTILINGKPLTGALTGENLRSLIDKETAPVSQ